MLWRVTCFWLPSARTPRSPSRDRAQHPHPHHSLQSTSSQTTTNMPKAEVGSTKFLNNKLKSKGLQRLRWYCQVCERQMRDENGFKMHTSAESHVRRMLLVGEDPKKYINDYSNQFQRDFLQLLRTSHGEKKVHLNHFYQEYISDRSHVHRILRSGRA